MKITLSRLPLTKIIPLRISREVITGSVNLLVTVEEDGVTGMGEVAPNSVTGDTTKSAEEDFGRWSEALQDTVPYEMQRIENIVTGAGGENGARTALDMALYDWLGKKAQLPIWRLLGLDRQFTPPTSVTVGIFPVDEIGSVTGDILRRTGAHILKVKLGIGVDADREMFAAVQKSAADAGYAPQWRVDANGGWNLAEARMMLPWLADRGVEMVEQPLAVGQEEDLTDLYRHRPLPIFADESVHVAADVPRLASCVDGVNLKLMKTGGLREALRLIAVARVHRLKIMIGCMGESSLAISAGAQITPLLDYVDLDSHLNLRDDPFTGYSLVEGRVPLSDLPGLGISIR